MSIATTEKSEVPTVPSKRFCFILPASLWQACFARSCDLDLDMSQYVRHLMRADLKSAKAEKCEVRMMSDLAPTAPGVSLNEAQKAYVDARKRAML